MPHLVILGVPALLIVVILCLAAGFAVAKVASRPSPLPPISSHTDIQQIIIDRVDKQHQAVGIVIGLIGPDDRRIIAHGQLKKNHPRALDGDTVFEIGSVTKVFTSLLLADMVQRGEVSLDDPVSKYLPPNVKTPERNSKSITLADLATHTSGLPRLPLNLVSKDPANPYADYSVDQLYRFLSDCTLTRDIGSQYEYSNIGGGLLGHVLAIRAGVDYETLVRTRICDPLGMADTRINLSPESTSRLAVGHNHNLHSVPNWDNPTLAGAGALRSTANDLLTLLAVHLGHVKSPLTPAMGLMLIVRRTTNLLSTEIGLGWHIAIVRGRQVIWHNGGTGGYRCFIAFDPYSQRGVVLLSNTYTAASMDDLGFHVLAASASLAETRATKSARSDSSRTSASRPRC